MQRSIYKTSIRPRGWFMRAVGCLFALMLVGCEEFFDEDLQEETLTLVSPADSLGVTNPLITFFWDEVDVDDPLSYRLMIATPSFSEIEQLVLDTTVTSTQFEQRLFPGKFQWRVQALNGSSTTAFTSRVLFVDSTTSIAGFTVVLREPDLDAYTSDVAPLFRWETFNEADGYRFQIYRGEFQTGSLFTNEIFTIDDRLQLDLDLDEGEYTWGVRAENGNTSTDYFTRRLVIDTTDPATPRLDSPLASAQVPDSVAVQFDWSQEMDSGAPLTYDLRVFADSLGNQLLEAIQTTETMHSESLNAGTYFWRVQATDAAGNVGEPSNFRRLNVLQ